MWYDNQFELDRGFEVDEPYTANGEYKYPDELVETYNHLHDCYDTHYPPCRKCKVQYAKKSAIRDFIIYTHAENHVIFTTLYYHEKTLLNITLNNPEYICSTCLRNINWYLYKIGDKYEIHCTGNGTAEITITSVPCKYELVNTDNIACKYVKELGNFFVFKEKHIAVPKSQLIYNKRSCQRENGYLVKSFSLDSEIVLIDEMGELVECDYYPFISKDDKTLTYGNDNITITVCKYFIFDTVCTIHSGKNTKLVNPVE